jgi:isopenicillin N synthase-like dioxygenase
MLPSTDALPVVDIGACGESDSAFDRVGAELDRACAEFGFFYVTAHGVDPRLCHALQQLANRFFALPAEEKQRIAMIHGGRAWRGYFPPGGELTSGRPDRKEGLYFGTELGPDDARVRAGLPLHGMNLYPNLPGFRNTLLRYLEAVTALLTIVAALPVIVRTRVDESAIEAVGREGGERRAAGGVHCGGQDVGILVE